MKKLVLAAAISLASASAIASTDSEDISIDNNWYIDANVTSYHFKRNANLNENNFGLGIEKRVSEDFRVMAGFYKNSIYKNSDYLLVGYTPVKFDTFGIKNELGFIAGAVTGYSQVLNGSNVMPAAGLLLSSEYKDFGVNVTVVPPVTSMKVYGFVGIQVKYKIN